MDVKDRRKGWDYTAAPVAEPEPVTVTTTTGRTSKTGTVVLAFAVIGGLFLWGLLRHTGPPITLKPGLPHTVVLDQWWSSDSAVEAARMHCEADCDSQYRQKAARAEEAQFTAEFTTAFQADPTCSGVTLSGFGDPFKDKSFPSSDAAHVLSGSDSYWSFQVLTYPRSRHIASTAPARPAPGVP